MNKKLSEFITHRALDFKLSGCPGVILEPKESVSDETINVATTIPISLNQELDSFIGLLGISKRQFVRLAIENALIESTAIVEEIDVFEYETPADPSLFTTVDLSDEDEEHYQVLPSDEEKAAFLQSKVEESQS